jgi:hypothetical protein
MAVPSVASLAGGVLAMDTIKDVTGAEDLNVLGSAPGDHHHNRPQPSGSGLGTATSRPGRPGGTAGRAWNRGRGLVQQHVQQPGPILSRTMPNGSKPECLPDLRDAVCPGLCSIVLDGLHPHDARKSVSAGD